MRTIVESIESEFGRYKVLGEKAFAQVAAEDLTRRSSEDANSIATLVWHVGGNLKSRFTDFLTTDGEKDWRDRESEFAARSVTADELRAKWEDGWSALRAGLGVLSDADLARTVTIRSQSLTVLDALQRSLAHTSYHVGQIVFLSRLLTAGRWEWLSIPPGQSDAFNRKMKGQ
jgi:uncharacterized damage-inducible protein DinB